MDSCVQHQNALSNTDHVENVNAQGNGGDAAGEYEVIKCYIKNNLFIAMRTTPGSFSLAKMHMRILKMTQYSGHVSMIFQYRNTSTRVYQHTHKVCLEYIREI